MFHCHKTFLKDIWFLLTYAAHYDAPALCVELGVTDFPNQFDLSHFNIDLFGHISVTMPI